MALSTVELRELSDDELLDRLAEEEEIERRSAHSETPHFPKQVD